MKSLIQGWTVVNEKGQIVGPTCRAFHEGKAQAVQGYGGLKGLAKRGWRAVQVALVVLEDSE